MAAKRIIPVPKRGVSTTGGGGGVDNFLDLTDTPNSYVGFAGHGILVNPTATGLTYTSDPLDVFGVKEFTTISNVIVGQPVYGYSVLEEVELAKADIATTSRVIGFTVFDALATNSVGLINSGYITRSDWTAITGTITLSFGATYFLSNTASGMMTLTAPITSGHYIVTLGVAVSDTIFSVNIGHPTRRA